MGNPPTAWHDSCQYSFIELSISVTIYRFHEPSRGIAKNLSISRGRYDGKRCGHTLARTEPRCKVNAKRRLLMVYSNATPHTTCMWDYAFLAVHTGSSSRLAGRSKTGESTAAAA
jgi:hypothetical protein